MPLPTIQYPIYELTVPSTQKTIRVRPFVVREEKLILMALESKDEKEIISTAKQIISNCILDNDFDVEKAPFFDVDYLFIALRGKSLGETIPLKLRCHAIVDGKDCNTKFDASADISNIEISKDNPSKTVELGPKLIVHMKYPTYGVMKALNANGGVLDNKINVVIACIDKIIQDGKSYSANEYSKEELTKFVEDLLEEQFMRLENFVDNFPSFAVVVQQKCPKCGFNHDLRYTDLTGFFQYSSAMTH